MKKIILLGFLLTLLSNIYGVEDRYRTISTGRAVLLEEEFQATQLESQFGERYIIGDIPGLDGGEIITLTNLNISDRKVQNVKYIRIENVTSGFISVSPTVWQELKITDDWPSYLVSISINRGTSSFYNDSVFDDRDFAIDDNYLDTDIEDDPETDNQDYTSAASDIERYPEREADGVDREHNDLETPVETEDPFSPHQRYNEEGFREDNIEYPFDAPERDSTSGNREDPQWYEDNSLDGENRGTSAGYREDLYNNLDSNSGYREDLEEQRDRYSGAGYRERLSEDFDNRSSESAYREDLDDSNDRSSSAGYREYLTPEEDRDGSEGYREGLSDEERAAGAGYREGLSDEERAAGTGYREGLSNEERAAGAGYREGLSDEERAAGAGYREDPNEVDRTASAGYREDLDDSENREGAIGYRENPYMDDDRSSEAGYREDIESINDRLAFGAYREVPDWRDRGGSAGYRERRELDRTPEMPAGYREDLEIERTSSAGYREELTPDEGRSSSAGYREDPDFERVASAGYREDLDVDEGRDSSVGYREDPDFERDGSTGYREDLDVDEGRGSSVGYREDPDFERESSIGYREDVIPDDHEGDIGYREDVIEDGRNDFTSGYRVTPDFYRPPVVEDTPENVIPEERDGTTIDREDDNVVIVTVPILPEPDSDGEVTISRYMLYMASERPPEEAEAMAIERDTLERPIVPTELADINALKGLEIAESAIRAAQANGDLFITVGSFNINSRYDVDNIVDLLQNFRTIYPYIPIAITNEYYSPDGEIYSLLFGPCSDDEKGLIIYQLRNMGFNSAKVY